MKIYELFDILKNKKYWNETGDKVNWDITTIKENGIVKIFLMFQDSDGFEDWKNNLNYLSTVYSKVYKNQYSKNLIVHKGFINAYKSSNDIIMKALLDKIESVKNECNNFDVIITGWSHGAALSQLAAEDLNFRTRKNINDINSGIKPKIIIFGSPKILVFNRTAEYIRKCCSEIIEVSQYNDLITVLPPFPRFKHISKSLKRVGTKLNIVKIFNPLVYHTSYDNKYLYLKSEFNEDV